MTITIELAKNNILKVWCAGGGRLSKNGCPKTLYGPIDDPTRDELKIANSRAEQHELRNGSHSITIYVPAILSGLMLIGGDNDAQEQ